MSGNCMSFTSQKILLVTVGVVFNILVNDGLNVTHRIEVGLPRLGREVIYGSLSYKIEGELYQTEVEIAQIEEVRDPGEDQGVFLADLKGTAVVQIFLRA